MKYIQGNLGLKYQQYCKLCDDDHKPETFLVKDHVLHYIITLFIRCHNLQNAMT